MLNGLLVAAVIVVIFVEYQPFAKCGWCRSRKARLTSFLTWSRGTKTPVPVTVINRRCWSCGYHEHIATHKMGG